MGFHWKNINPFHVAKEVVKSVADIPGSVKQFAKNPLQSVEKNLGGVVNTWSLGTIGAKNRVKVGGAVLTAGTATLASAALSKPAPTAKAAATAGALKQGGPVLANPTLLNNIKDRVGTALTDTLKGGGRNFVGPPAPTRQQAPRVAQSSLGGALGGGAVSPLVIGGAAFMMLLAVIMKGAG